MPNSMQSHTDTSSDSVVPLVISFWLRRDFNREGVAGCVRQKWYFLIFLAFILHICLSPNYYYATSVVEADWVGEV